MKNFKRFFISLTVFCIVAASQKFEDGQYESEVKGVIENSINSTINKIRANMTDPVAIDSKNFDFGEGESLSGGFNVSSLKINGIKNFVATDIEVDIASQKVNINIALDDLVINFKYWADILLVNLVPLYGHGRMSVSFDEIQVDVEATASSTDGPKVRDLVLQFLLSETTFDLNGLIDNPEYSALISAALNDNFENFVNNNSRLISETISPIVETIINSFLEPEEGKLQVKSMEVFMKPR